MCVCVYVCVCMCVCVCVCVCVQVSKLSLIIINRYDINKLYTEVDADKQYYIMQCYCCSDM